MLYTTDSIVLRSGVSFLVGVNGASEILPRTGLVRLGGDGRGASLAPWDSSGTDQPWMHRPKTKGFRLILATPGLFPGGWLPPRVEQRGTEYVLRVDGLAARLVAAAISRADVISGWDLAKRSPKPAVRVVPAGSVYWFEIQDGAPAVLDKLLADGLWPESLDPAMRIRRSEGFNNVWLGDWDPSGL